MCGISVRIVNFVHHVAQQKVCSAKAICLHLIIAQFVCSFAHIRFHVWSVDDQTVSIRRSLSCDCDSEPLVFSQCFELDFGRIQCHLNSQCTTLDNKRFLKPKKFTHVNLDNNCGPKQRTQFPHFAHWSTFQATQSFSMRIISCRPLTFLTAWLC